MKRGKKNKGSRKHPKKCSPRMKSTWYRDKKDIPQQAIVPKDLDDFKLNEDAAKNALAFPHSNEHVIEAIKNHYGSPISEDIPRSKRKPKADVHCINEEREKRGLQLITTPSQATAAAKKFAVEQVIHDEWKVYKKWGKRTDWYVSKGLESAMETLELKMRLSGKVGHWKKESEFVGPPKPDNSSKTNGYSFANKKPVVKTGLAPSGLPISEFLEGGKYPPRLHSVTPEWPESVPSPAFLEKEAANNPAFSLTVADVQWYINKMKPDDWPSIIREHVYHTGKEWKPDKSKLLGKSGMSLKAQFDELERDYAAMQVEHWNERVILLDKNEALNEQLGLALQELSFARDQVKMAELHSVTSGHQASKEVKSLSTSQLANLFNVFKVQVKDNPLHAFCTQLGIGIEQEKQIRAQFDLECSQRLAVSHERNFYRRLAERNKLYRTPRVAARVHKEIKSLRRIGNSAGYGAWLQAHAKPPEYVTLCNKRIVFNTVRNEKTTYAKWSDRNNNLNCNKSLNNRVAVIEAQEIERIKALMNTTTYKVLSAVKSAWNYELDPRIRKRDADEAKRSAALRKKSLKDKAAKASRIKEMREQQAEESAKRILNSRCAARGTGPLNGELETLIQEERSKLGS